MAEHTAGPWVVAEDCGDFDTLAIYSSSGLKLVWWGGHYNVPIEEAEANARLIASAPELLEACKSLLAVIMDEPGNGMDSLLGSTDPVIQYAYDAVAKAEAKEA